MVTNMPVSRGGANHLNEKFHCVRGEMENRTKEKQLGLFVTNGMDSSSPYQFGVFAPEW